MLLAVGTAASVGAEEGDSHEDFDDIPSVSRRYFSSLLLLFLCSFFSSFSFLSKKPFSSYHSFLYCFALRTSLPGTGNSGTCGGLF